MAENPWRNLPGSPPYVLDSDRPFIDAYNRYAAGPGQRIKLEALPEPFIGRPDAPVVVLLANPAAGELDSEWDKHQGLARAIRTNLAHETVGYPFFYLDPALHSSPGAIWWNSGLKRLIEQCGRVETARGVLAVEFHGYHSRFSGPLPVTLPSQRYGFGLAHEAMAREAVIILGRKRPAWKVAVPGLAAYPRCYELTNPQSAFITIGNCPDGFEIAVQAIKAQGNA